MASSHYCNAAGPGLRTLILGFARAVGAARERCAILFALQVLRDHVVPDHLRAGAAVLENLQVAGDAVVQQIELAADVVRHDLKVALP